MHVDLLIHSAAQVVTCASSGGPKRKEALADAGIIPDGAVAIADGQIVAVGPTAELRADYTGRDRFDLSGYVVCPGFVDCHTHVIYAGDRVDEFEKRILGATYMDILLAGGGILNTMRATRAASVDQLAAQARPRLDEMLALGTTTVEVKTGYGLDTHSELNMLKAAAALAGDTSPTSSHPQAHPIQLVPTFLGAHTIPPQFETHPDDYLDVVIGEMLPRVVDWYADSVFARRDVPLFCDVFCEANVFDLQQAERVLRAGRELGMGIKIHADEFQSLGGVALAVEMGAVSADHLDVTPAEEIQALAISSTVGVVLPAVNFHLGSHHYADARAMVDAGVALALATDLNPGSAPCFSLPLVMAVACRYQRLSPAEALNACTINAAHAIQMGHRLGSIEIGKQADLLVLDTTDYRHLAYKLGGNPVVRVIKKGTFVV
jgi:imidazolonepropionase